MKNQELLPPVGTKVWDAVKYPGLDGKIKEHGNIIDKFPLRVKFKGIDEMVSYTAEGKYNTVSPIQQLSATPYDLINGGFTPISEWNKPKIGDVGYFWDTQDEPLFEKACIRYGVLVNILKHDDLPYESQDGLGFEYFSVEMPEWYKNNIQQIKAELASPKKK